MTYRDKLLFVSSRLLAGPMTDEERLTLGTQLGRDAIQVGHIEECLDGKVEEARVMELAQWSGSSDVVVRFPRRAS